MCNQKEKFHMAFDKLINEKNENSAYLMKSKYCDKLSEIKNVKLIRIK